MAATPIRAVNIIHINNKTSLVIIEVNRLTY